jgi:hypothetical protein
MTDATRAERARPGDWVEVERVLLEPADRSKNLPPETAEKPLMMWVKGFAEGSGAVGDELTIETMTGRKVTGRLSAVNPGYFHTFGRPIPELQHIGVDLRARLAGYHAAAGAEGGRPAGPVAQGGPADSSAKGGA